MCWLASPMHTQSQQRKPQIVYWFVVSDFDLHQSLSKETIELIKIVEGFRQHHNRTQIGKVEM